MSALPDLDSSLEDEGNAASDHDLEALRLAASRAEEAAAKVATRAMSYPIPYTNVARNLGLPNAWTAPLTPDDSCEESSFQIKSESTASTFDPGFQDRPVGSTPGHSQVPLSDIGGIRPSAEEKKPSKQNVIDSIATTSQPQNLELPVAPRKRGQPPGSKSKYARKLQHGQPVWSVPISQDSQDQSKGLGDLQTSMTTQSLGPKGLVSKFASKEKLERPQEFVREGRKVVKDMSEISEGLPSISKRSMAVQPSAAETESQIVQENNLLKTMFKSEIGPIMDEVMGHYELKLPRKVLLSVGRAFASEIINQNLRESLREGQYVVSPLFKEIAHGTLQRMLLKKLRDTGPGSSGCISGSSSPQSPLDPSQSSALAARVGDGSSLRSFDILKGNEDHWAGSVEAERAAVVNERGPKASTPKLNAEQDHLSYCGSDFESHSVSPFTQLAKANPSTQSRLHALLNERYQPSKASSQTVPPSAKVKGSAPKLSQTRPLADNRVVICSQDADRHYSNALLSQNQSIPTEYSLAQGRTTSQRHQRHPPNSDKRTRDMSRRSVRQGIDAEDVSGREMPSNTPPEPMSPDSRPTRRADLNAFQALTLAATASGCRGSYFSTSRMPGLDSILRHRELGLGRWNGSSIDIGGMNTLLRMTFAQRLACWRKWIGASKDVVATAWAPDGSTYAAGASTEMDNLNIQYNRPNNLLLGNNDTNTLTELPDHFVNRPRPETIESGDNSLQGTYNTVDPELYTTVSHVCFGHESDRLFSASFDKTVKIWDLTRPNKVVCIETLRHKANVELLALSTKPSSLLATGQRTIENSIHVYIPEYSHLGRTTFSSASSITFESSRARKYQLHPTCLLWGLSSATSNLLLAGFSENRDDGNGFDQEGDLCLWNVETRQSLKLIPSSQAIQDVTWHPTLPLLAAASAPGASKHGMTNRRTRSVIRTYQPLEVPGRIMEYECPALDINDIRFHPYDDHYISAGCTDGVTYVWDVRMPEKVLHRLRHGDPIDELDYQRTREEQDTGVRFTAWDKDGRGFYTGSSDGVIKEWNIFANSEDTFVRDVAHFDASVMTGCFSPDFTNLLVGLSMGAVHVLSTAPLTHEPNEDAPDPSPTTPRQAYETINYIPHHRPAPTTETSGIEIAKELVASGQLTMHPIYGAGKGPNYDGPFAAYARPEGSDPTFEDLEPDILASQLDLLERKRGRQRGGNLDRESQMRYREANKVAEARNGPFRFREGRREAEKRAREMEEEEDEGMKKGRVEVRREEREIIVVDDD